MRIVAVTDLPWPHHPYKCAFADEFGATVPGDVGFDDRPRYFVSFAVVLSAQRLEACRYHAANWPVAAEAAIHVWEDDAPDVDAAVERLLAAGESEDTVEAMCSFFWEPIFINGTLLGNGQHRVCAMKLAGVPRCLMRTERHAMPLVRLRSPDVAAKRSLNVWSCLKYPRWAR